MAEKPKAATKPEAAAETKPEAPEAPKPPEAPKQPEAPRRIRIICRRPNAGAIISGIAFADVTIGESTLHISQALPPSDANVERLLRIEGYEVWAGDEEEYARAIEDALRAAARTAPAAVAAANATQDEALEEQRRANRKIASDLVEARQRIETLVETNRALQAELDALKERGNR